MAKAIAQAANQQLYSTPPFIGKLLSIAELVWIEPKYDYKRTPAKDRVSDADCVLKLKVCLQKQTDYRAYVSRPARYTLAVLLATRDA